MRITFRLYLLLLFLFIVLKIPAQTLEVRFNLITDTDGNALHLNGITQDKYGYMWFADQTQKAIIRYDGHYMKKYRNDFNNPNSLGGHNPECLASDSLGNIWIGFYGNGLDKFDPVTGIFTHYRHDPKNETSLRNNVVSAVLVDHLGNVWVGTNGGLDLLDPKTGKFKHYYHKANDSTSLSHNVVRSIYEDKAGEIWIATGFFPTPANIGGLNRFHRDTETFTRYLSDPANPQTLIDNRVKAIFEDSYGNFWIGTNGDGLHTFDRKTGLFKRFLYNPKQPNQLSRPPLKSNIDHITFITEDSDKKIWIGTHANGLIRYDPISKTTTHYGNENETKDGPKLRSTWTAYTTSDGLIWLVCGMAEGLVKIDINSKAIPHVEMGPILDFNEEGDSIGWYATERGLVCKNFRNGSTHKFIHDPANPNSLSNDLVRRIRKDKAGNFWIATENGLNHFNPRTETFTRYLYDPGKNAGLTITNIYVASDSTLWMSIHGRGLDFFNWKTGKLTNFKNDPNDTSSLSYDYISLLFMGDSNDLWVGTWGWSALNRLNLSTGKFSHYLNGINIHSIYRDASGIMWVGSTAGLHYYDKRSDSFIPIENESNRDAMIAVNAITGDKDSNLWMSTTNGIYMLNKKREHWYHYGKEYGIAKPAFVNGSSFTRHDGEIFFGDISGYFSFYPEKLKTTASNISIYFTGFWLSNKETKNEALLKKPLDQTNEIRLRHDQNAFSFTATYIDFRNTQDKPIHFKLEDFDIDWRKARAEDKIQYTRVPPGEYILRIKVLGNSNGEWIEKNIKIIIDPPWWNTWWFIIAAIIVVLAAIYTLLRWRFYEKFNRQLELSEKEKKLAELQQQKTELEMQVLRAQMNPHFIFNSLNSINRFILQHNSPLASEYLTKFSRLVRMILQNSQAPLISLESELESLKLYLELEALRFNYHFAYKITVPKELDIEVLKVPPLIIQPYAENAIWHGLMHKEEKGRLDIELSQEKDHLILKISDDGIGRKAAAVKSKSVTRHTSMGLQITADRITKLQSSNGSESPVTIIDLMHPDGSGAGTEVIIKIPVIYD